MKSNSKKRKASEKSDEDEDEKTTRPLPVESEGIKLSKTTPATDPGADSELKSVETTTVVEASGSLRESPEEKTHKTPEKATPTITQDNETTTNTASDLPTTSSRTPGGEGEEQQRTQSMKDVTAEREEAKNEEGESGRTLEITTTTTTTATTKSAKSVRFTNVKIFEFERCQGFSSIPGNFAPFNETITLGMQYQHENEQVFESLDEYFRYKRRVDLDKVETFVRQQEQHQLAADRIGEMPPSTTSSDDSDTILTTTAAVSEAAVASSDSALDLFEQARLERAKHLLANRDVYENDLSIDLDIDPDISCPVLTNEERIEKLAGLVIATSPPSTTNESDFAAAATAGEEESNTNTVSLDLFDRSECEEVNEILKSREICGCDCSARNQTCTSDDCSCFANGINCQIDRMAPYNYPCRCNSKKCKNTFGLRKFNLRQVEKHKREVLTRTRNETKASDEDLSKATTTNEQPEELETSISKANKTPPRRKKRLSSYSPHKRKKQK